MLFSRLSQSSVVSLCVAVLCIASVLGVSQAVYAADSHGVNNSEHSRLHDAAEAATETNTEQVPQISDSPLIAAVRSWNQDEVTRLGTLVRNNDVDLDINAVDSCGCTALHVAIERDGENDERTSRERMAMIKLFISLGANVNLQDSKGMTPLMYAAQRKDFEAVQALFCAGAKVTLKSKEELTALQYAQKGEESLEAAAYSDVHKFIRTWQIDILDDVFLGDEGTDPTILSSFQSTWVGDIADRENPRSSLFRRVLRDVISSGRCNDDVFDFLIDFLKKKIGTLDVYLNCPRKNADPDSGVYDTALICAARCGRPGYVKKLLQGGASVDKRGMYNETALHGVFGPQSGADATAAIVESLIQGDAVVDARDNFGCSPLHYAVSRSDVGSVKALLKAKAIVDMVATNGETPLMQLRKHKDSVEVARALISAGAKVNVRSRDGKTPLFNTLAQRDVESATLLLQKGADVTVHDKNNQEVLHYAALYLKKEGDKVISALVGQFCDKGANLNKQNRWGLTPLMVAASNENVAVAKVLIDRGACKDTLCSRGKTALEIAKDNKDQEMIALLSGQVTNKSASTSAPTEKSGQTGQEAALAGARNNQSSSSKWLPAALVLVGAGVTYQLYSMYGADVSTDDAHIVSLGS